MTKKQCKSAEVQKNKKPITKQLSPADRLDAIGIEVICDYVANGDSLRSWALNNNFAQQTVINWIEADETRARHYARARDDRADAVFESLDDVSERAVNAESAVEVAGLRLKSDNIKWKLARMNAKKYGEKIQHGGADDLSPIKITRIESVIVRPSDKG